MRQIENDIWGTDGKMEEVRERKLYESSAKARGGERMR